MPVAGLVAVVILAAHPWMVRYSTEARGYGLTFFLWPLAALSLLKGINSGRWRWWLCFSLAEASLLWSWTGMVHWLLPLNAAALGLIAGNSDPAVRFQLRRWTASGLLALVCYMPLGLPMLPQLRSWMATDRAKSNGLPAEWSADALSWLLTGEPWHSPDPSNALCPGRLEDLSAQPLMTALYFAAGIGALGWGVRAFWRRSRESR